MLRLIVRWYITKVQRKSLPSSPLLMSLFLEANSQSFQALFVASPSIHVILIIQLFLAQQIGGYKNAAFETLSPPLSPLASFLPFSK